MKSLTNELIYETGADSQRTDLWLPKWGEIEEGLGLAGASYYV